MRPLRTLLPLALLVAGLALPAPAATAETVRPDFSGYQRLLHRYVEVVSAKGRPYDTRFDYEQLFVDERIWTLKRSDRLEQVRQQLLATPPSRLAPDDRTAWLINMHNFLVIERITLHLLVPNRGFLRVKGVDEIFRSSGPFTEAPWVEVDGRSYSIGRFERELIHGDTLMSYEPRVARSDPRLLFALAHGLAGAPPLLPWAYHGDSLDAQLDRAVTIGTALPRLVRVNDKLKRLELSNLFFEHRVDFGGVDEIRPWLEKHAARDVRRALARLPEGFAPAFVEVDRRLNQVERRKTTDAPADSVRVSS